MISIIILFLLHFLLNLFIFLVSHKHNPKLPSLFHTLEVKATRIASSWIWFLLENLRVTLLQLIQMWYHWLSIIDVYFHFIHLSISFLLCFLFLFDARISIDTLLRKETLLSMQLSCLLTELLDKIHFAFLSRLHDKFSCFCRMRF